MKMTFLGTSHGYPGKTRYCTCNMLEIGEDIYIFDAGAPLSDILFRREIPFDRVKAIFITHSHLDHMNGVPYFLAIAKWHASNCSTICYLPDEYSVKAIKPILDDRPEMSNTNIGIKLFKEGLVYEDENISVRAIPNNHLQNVSKPSYGFEVFAKEKTFLITGDLTDTMDDFPKVAFEKHFDCIITECAHAKPETLEGKLREVDADTVVINHVYPPYKEDYFRNLDGALDCKIIVGEDDDEIYI